MSPFKLSSCDGQIAFPTVVFPFTTVFSLVFRATAASFNLLRGAVARNKFKLWYGGRGAALARFTNGVSRIKICS